LAPHNLASSLIDAGRHRQVLLQPQHRTELTAQAVGQGFRGTHHQVAGSGVEPGRLRPNDLERQRLRRRCLEPVAGIGEHDQTFELVIAVVATAGDMQV
jgi:hypothetical protein